MRAQHHPWALILLLAAGGSALALAATDAPAQATVYRCTDPNGGIEFRQQPCGQRDATEQVQIEDNRTGWVPPTPQPEKPAKRESKAKKSASATAGGDRDADRCWRLRHQLDGINNQLRAGYKPQQGERLKRRRRDAEAKLNRYCR